MKIFKITSFFVCTIFAMAGCLDNNTESEPIVEPIVKSEYYITNQSDVDLNVAYKISFLPVDSTVAVPRDSTTKIFEAGGIGGDTFPSSAFANLSFYKKSDDKATPLLTIEPIANENWNRIAGEVDNVTKFELTITKSDLN